jgi:hypothetical protein
MIGLLSSLLVKVVALRALLTLIGSVLVAVPAGLLILKVVALPLLAVLAIVGLPLLFAIALLGFPFFLVFAIGGVALAVLAGVVMFGLVALKLFLFVVLPVWIVFRLARWIARGGRTAAHGSRATDAAGM